MLGRKLWYIVTLAMLALLPLAGCSGGGSSSTKQTEKGTEVTVSGKVDAKSSAKTLFLSATSAAAANNVFVYDAQTGAQLAFAPIASNGSFNNLTFTLPSTKTVLVFKAIVAQGTFRSVVPIDLSNPPAAGAITGSNPISIVISQESNNTAAIVSSMLGLTGLLGDPGMTLDSVNKTYADAAQLVVDFGGQQLAYSGSGLALTGKLSSAALLPAQDANTLSVDQLNNMTLNGAITMVSIPGNSPIVSFQVKNSETGKGVKGLKTLVLAVAQLKTATNGPSAEWLSYMVTGSTSRPGTETSTTGTAPNLVPLAGSSLIDNGDGSYTYKMAKDIKNGTGGTVTYDANLTHRLMVQVRTTPSRALQNNGSFLSNFYNELLMAYTYVPATGTAIADAAMPDIAFTAACNECHGKIGVTTPHGGRGDVRYCMMCHTAQRANGRTNSASVAGAFTGTTYIADGEVSGDFVTMIHKIHMGSKLTKTGYDYAGVKFNPIVYPKEIINCRQCHQAGVAAAPKGDNWRTQPSRKTCGACHDNINFATGANTKVGGAAHSVQTNDANCASCHGDADLHHTSINATPNNPNTPAGLVNFYYDVQSAVVDPVTNNLTIKFKIQQNTGSLTAAKTNVVFDGTASNPLVGFTGGPSFLLAYFQDTPNQPAATFNADYNNLGVKAAQPKTVSIGSLLGGTTGTLGTPDASGYYSAVVNSAAAFPVGATLRAVGLQGYFTQISPAAARHALSIVKPVTGDAVRRDVIDSAKCANCHEWFEGHGGNRVVGKDTIGQSICTLCHVPNLSTSGRGSQQSLIQFIITNPVGTPLGSVTNLLTGAAFSGTVSQGAKDAMTALQASLGTDPTLYPEASNNFKDMVHGIHAGSDPLVVGTPLQFVRDRGTSGDFDYNFSFVTFPGVLKNCTMCHKGTTYTTIPAKVQVSTQVTTRGTALTLQTDAVTGNNVTETDLARKAVPNAADLVNTPFVATCKACHNRPNALAHFAQNGGQINVRRDQANPDGEACITCHGTTGPNALWNVHRFSVVGE